MPSYSALDYMSFSFIYRIATLHTVNDVSFGLGQKSFLRTEMIRNSGTSEGRVFEYFLKGLV